MDVFFEQIIEIKKTAKDYVMLIGLWLLVALVAAAVMFFVFPFIGPIALFPILAAGFGAYKLSMVFFVEYEYIITNGTLDIDKIIAKNSRKRMASFEISSVESVTKYNPQKKVSGNYERVIIACNKDDPNAYEMIVSKEGVGKQYIVFSPNEKIKGATMKYLPKYIANSAFK